MKPQDISAWPVMAAKCKSCPFGPNGDEEIRTRVEGRALEVSQICHHPRTLKPERPETHLCRGSRDYQLRLLHGMGIIEAPTDEAWTKKRKEYGV